MIGESANPFQVVVRRDTLAMWLQVDPVLGVLEPAYATDVDILKLGDGQLRWSELPEYTKAEA